MISPEAVEAELLYQRAVVRVFSPWLSSDVLPGREVRWAHARVEHARLVLVMGGVDLPGSAPAVVAFNDRWERQTGDRLAPVNGG